MPSMKLSAMREKGQITIPQELRELQTIGEILKEQGLTLEDMMERGREIRGKIIEERYPRLAKKTRKSKK